MSVSLGRIVCNSMERIAPLRLAEKWDNVGLLLEAPNQLTARPNRILLTIDLTTAVCGEAIERDASVIIAYHPPIFSALKSFTLANPLQASLLRCAAKGISVYCPHTALDCVWGGINDWISEGLLSGSTGKVSALGEEKINTQGVSEGALGRIVHFDQPISIEELASRAKRHLDIPHVQATHTGSKSVSSVAICAGSGGSVLLGQDADVYFTGEMDHHGILAAVAAGKNVMLCGHTNTERGYLPRLATRLQTDLHESGEAADILIGEMDRHPLVLF